MSLGSPVVFRRVQRCRTKKNQTSSEVRLEPTPERRHPIAAVCESAMARAIDRLLLNVIMESSQEEDNFSLTPTLTLTQSLPTAFYPADERFRIRTPS